MLLNLVSQWQPETVGEVVAPPVLREDVNVNAGCRKLTDKCVTTGRRGEAESRTSRVMMCQKLMLFRGNQRL